MGRYADSSCHPEPQAILAPLRISNTVTQILRFAQDDNWETLALISIVSKEVVSSPIMVDKVESKPNTEQLGIHHFSLSSRAAGEGSRF